MKRVVIQLNSASDAFWNNLRSESPDCKAKKICFNHFDNLWWQETITVSPKSVSEGDDTFSKNCII